jgi:hypothetical protein
LGQSQARRRSFSRLIGPQFLGQFPCHSSRRFTGRLHRDDSFDSRFWGTVKREKIVGRATTVVLSLDKSNYWLPRWSRTLSSLKSE